MKNIFAGLVIVVSSSIFGQVTILEENFEGTVLPSTWTIIDNDGHTVDDAVQEYTQAWIYKEDPHNAGNGTASSTSFFNPVDRADRWLITPQLTLGAAANYISWKGLSYDASFPDSYKVMVSKTGNAVTDFKDTLLIVSNETPYWTSHVAALDAFANESIYIAFVNTTYNGFKLLIDSIYVREQDPLALSKEEFTVGIYPHPIEDEVTISVGSQTILDVDVFNLFGQKITHFQPNMKGGEFQMNMAHLETGIFIFSITTPEGIVRKRVIKK